MSAKLRPFAPLSNAEESLATLIRWEKPRKGPAKGTHVGSANSYWKGDAAGYKAFHKRVAAARGRPKVCSRCGATDPAKTYEWASLSGRYADLSDYARMCRSCHRYYDRDRRPPSTARLSRPCDHCGTTFDTWLSHVRRGRRFCSQPCASAARRR